LKKIFEAHINNVATPYLISIFSIFIATVIRLWPLSALELRIPWVTFYPAVMVCAIFSGFRSGLFTTFLSVFVVLFLSFNGTPFIDDSGDWLGLFVFSLNSVFISIMGGMMHQAKRTAIRLKDKAEDAKNMLEKKVAERTKELSQSVGQLRSLFANSPFPIMVYSENGRIIMINQAWTQLTGYELVDIPTLCDWVKKAYGENIEKIGLKIAPHLSADRRVDEGEIKIRAKEGNTLIWDFSSAPLGETTGGQKLIVSMAKDITDKKALETKLSQSQKMEAIGTLAGGIAHDFNNLLSIILGYTDIVIEGLPEDSQNASDLREVYKAASRATIDIRLNLDPNCKSVLADPTQIHQVILNLCTNAYHTMRDDDGVLSIKLESVVLPRDDDNTNVHIRPGEYVKLIISDTGTGISKHIQEKIFDPYFTTKAKGEGTGLGLAVVHGIVKQYNGEITVDSKPDEGTTFSVYLPAIKEDRESIPKENSFTLPRGNESILNY
jgi:PAS domain S-box-containing protein